MSERKFMTHYFLFSLDGCNKLCLIVDNLIFNFPTLKEKFYPTKLVAMLTLVGWKKLLFHESMVCRLWVIKIDIMGSQSFFFCVCFVLSLCFLVYLIYYFSILFFTLFFHLWCSCFMFYFVLFASIINLIKHFKDVHNFVKYYQ